MKWEQIHEQYPYNGYLLGTCLSPSHLCLLRKFNPSFLISAIELLFVKKLHLAYPSCEYYIFILNMKQLKLLLEQETNSMNIHIQDRLLIVSIALSYKGNIM
jgi:hypothetical protein